ncbi:MAG: hypothetical protein JWO91_3728 [Acidobacteriaceae bacterium]|nr:hypothetical protein [Acidobacteriaceae bacterium]
MTRAFAHLHLRGLTTKMVEDVHAIRSLLEIRIRTENLRGRSILPIEFGKLLAQTIALGRKEVRN